jgi:alpha-galactosidase
MLDLARDMAEVCPGALLLNYTNPMSMLVWAVYDAFPAQQILGLCHSVQGTARQIAAYIGVPPADLVYTCAGINHIAWMLRLEVEGVDVYPRLRAAAGDPAVYARDKVRFALLKHLGYFVTESSEHSAEYTPYFLRDDALIARYDVPVDEYVRRSEANLREYAETRRKLLAGESFPLARSEEYGAPIIHSIATGEPRVVYANVRNTGLVENLPDGCCVEVPVVVDRTGAHPCHVGRLPPQLAGMCLPHVSVQELVVRAALDGDRAHIQHALMLDRHAASVLALDDMQRMIDELIVAHGASLPPGIRT